MIADQAYDLLQQAAQRGDNDLFLKPIVMGWLIYGRQTGQSVFVMQLDLAQGQALINYFKFNAQMDLSEQRRPQIGAWHYQEQRLTLDLRLTSVADFQNRECLVIRLLYPIRADGHFINEQRFQILRGQLRQRGLFLFSGPTGSGKTTLLYQLAQQLAQSQMVLAIEDPTEINAPEITQLQVNDLAEMDYQALLKISLRLRPDILVIGEIRDAQTAAIAVQAALSGHTVLATIHARSAPGTLLRLADLGVAPATIASVVTVASYQRLVPLTDGNLAVGLDLMTASLIQQWVKDENHHVNQWEVWQNDLQQACEQNRITSTVYQQFACG